MKCNDQTANISATGSDRSCYRVTLGQWRWKICSDYNTTTTLHRCRQFGLASHRILCTLFLCLSTLSLRLFFPFCVARERKVMLDIVKHCMPFLVLCCSACVATLLQNINLVKLIKQITTRFIPSTRLLVAFVIISPRARDGGRRRRFMIFLEYLSLTRFSIAIETNNYEIMAIVA